jgi:hypothetical protein
MKDSSGFVGFFERLFGFEYRWRSLAAIGEPTLKAPSVG